MSVDIHRVISAAVILTCYTLVPEVFPNFRYMVHVLHVLCTCIITYNMNDVVTRNKPKDAITTVPKRDVFHDLAYLGLQSKFIAKQLTSCIYKFYGCINLKIVFRNTHRIVFLPLQVQA